MRMHAPSASSSRFLTSSRVTLRRKARFAIDGVSLTVNEVDGSKFSVCLIPHTLEVTTLGSLGTGDEVNLEVDLIARYLERLMAPELQEQD